MATAVDRAFKRLQRDLGLRLREVRRERGLSQADAAKRVGMTLDNYVKIERGRRNVTLHTVTRLAVALGVDVPELFRPPLDRNPKPGRPRKPGA